MNSPSSLDSGQPTMPAPDKEGIFEAELSKSAHSQQRGPIQRAGLALLFVAAAAVPLIIYWLPSEKARWQIAAAQAKWLEGDLPGAISTLEIAAKEFPDRPSIYEQRIQFYFKAGQYEQALADAQELVKLSPKSPDALGLESQAFHHLGRHEEAINVCKEIKRLAQEEWIGSIPHALNSLAYAQAIGNTELDEALKDIDEALRLAGDNPAMLDTRGYLKYRLGDSKSAKEDVEKAVEQWERLVAYQDTQYLTGVKSFQVEWERESYQQALAVMLYHRSLVYDRLKMIDKAKVDRERVYNLGYEPNDQLF